MATLATYRVKVQSEVDDTSARAQTVIDNGLADVYQEILRFIPELVGTETTDVAVGAGDSAVTIPAFTKIKSLHWSTDDVTYNILQGITEDDYLINDVNAVAVENPSKYFVNGDSAQLVPASSLGGFVRITYYPVSAELVGNETSVIPARFSEVMVLGGIARFYAYMRLPDADSYKKDYYNALDEMRTEIVNSFRRPQPTLYGRRRYAFRRV